MQIPGLGLILLWYVCKVEKHLSRAQVVQGMSVFLLTTNMRLFLNPIINHIFHLY